MTQIVGIDLNGALDCAVNMDGQGGRWTEGGVPSVVVLDLGQNPRDRLMAGPEAALSSIGRGTTWPSEADPSYRIPVIHALLRLTEDKIKPFRPNGRTVQPVEIVGAALRQLCPREEEATLAIPDSKEFDERAQQRLIEAASACGIGATLLWRPVATVLGWASGLSSADVHGLGDQSVAVVSILADGVYISALNVKKSSKNANLPYLVPERRAFGVKMSHVNAEKSLRNGAMSMSQGDERLTWQLTWGTDAGWSVLLGRASAMPQQLLERSHRWFMEQDPVPVDVIPPVIADVSGHDIVGAKRVLVEGPVTHAVLLESALKSLCLTPDDPRIVRVGPQSAARGCAEAAKRMATNRVVYFDFLPQLEIAVLREGRPCFASLVPSNHRVEGGQSYRNALDDRFRVQQGTPELQFYLIKQGFDWPRRSVVEIPAPPAADVDVTLTVEQRPAQGYARIVVTPDQAGALGAGDTILNWDRMEIVKKTRDEILKELEPAPAYPDHAPQRAHPILWAKGSKGPSLAEKISELIDVAALSPTTQNQYLDAAKVVCGHLSRRQSPYYLSKQADPDKTKYTVISSDGKLPQVIFPYIASDDAAKLISHVHERAVSNWLLLRSDAKKFHPKTKKHILSALERLMTWSFVACPEPVVDYYRNMLREGKIVDPLRSIRGMGRVLQSSGDIQNFFQALEAQKHLGNNHLAAAKDLIFFRQDAAGLLSSNQAIHLLRNAYVSLKKCNNKQNYKIMFMNCLGLIGALLRFRSKKPDFVLLNRDPSAKYILQELEKSKTALSKNDPIKVHILDQLIDFIEGKGGNPNLLTEVQNAEEEDLTEDAGDDDQ